jgi:hypothetical protein
VGLITRLLIIRNLVSFGTYDHRVWRTGLPVRSAVLKPHSERGQKLSEPWSHVAKLLDFSAGVGERGERLTLVGM